MIGLGNLQRWDCFINTGTATSQALDSRRARKDSSPSRTSSLVELIEHYIDCDIGLGKSSVIKRGPHILLDYNIWEKGVARAPLNGRGWVLQERVLSPRTIHFGSDQFALGVSS